MAKEKKITALKNVRVLVSIEQAKPFMIGREVYRQPTKKQEMISLRKGESRSDVTIFYGIDPTQLPKEPSTTIKGVYLLFCVNTRRVRLTNTTALSVWSR